MDLQSLILTIILLPLAGSLLTGIFGRKFSLQMTYGITCSLVGLSFLLSCYLAKLYLLDGWASYNDNLYLWGWTGNLHLYVGFLIDQLTALIFLVVTFVSLLVHIYSIGYMAGEEGRARFFSYISLFTFAMLMLVSANNFLQLFFGWEGVGLVSYLLIGFYFKKESANQGALKAFLVNRVGDFGLLLGLAAVVAYFGSLDYVHVFAVAPALSQVHLGAITFICLMLFVGAMGKSAQVPLHVWLPESMEGPTPISALIHAATMVTAGIYMVARLSPLYELSTTALSFILIVGATTAFFTGLIGIVQNDIKRVVAYSTLSQLGYMVAGLGASAFTASIFHLATHAAFKALLFLAAGSVIIALHHEQDMRKMGALARRLPFTYVMFLIGALALAAIPPFSGFYSKDAIIEAVKHASLFGAGYAYVLLLCGAFVTALYIFRAFFMVFHTASRVDSPLHEIKEPSWTMGLPLFLLAIPSILLGLFLVIPLLYSTPGLLGHAVVSGELESVVSLSHLTFEGLFSAPLYFSLAGLLIAWLSFVKYPHWAAAVSERFKWVRFVLIEKYGFDAFYNLVFVQGILRGASVCYRNIDTMIIDHQLVNGSGRFILRMSHFLKRLQSGYLYHYALAMMLGLILLGLWQVLIR
jgi:NADH-quinone oxidoreductase subunit L